MSFEIEKWVQGSGDEDSPAFAGMATYGETRQAVILYLTEIKLFDKLEYLSAQGEDNAELPRFDRLACYAVPTYQNGHDIYVEAIDLEGRRCPILRGKTFWGYFLACEIAGELARYLYQDNS